MDAAEARFYVDGELEATHSTDLPASATKMKTRASIRTDTNAARDLYCAWITGSQATDV